MITFICSCGQTETEKRPMDCEVAPCCGSKIVGPGEIYDEPIAHAFVIREDGTEDCKRCKKKK